MSTIGKDHGLCFIKLPLERTKVGPEVVQRTPSVQQASNTSFDSDVSNSIKNIVVKQRDIENRILILICQNNVKL